MGGAVGGMGRVYRARACRGERVGGQGGGDPHLETVGFEGGGLGWVVGWGDGEKDGDDAAKGSA